MEISIAMALMTMLGSLLFSSMSVAQRANSQVDDQDRGLSDLQVVTERLSRDLRVARGVDTLATTSQLTIWIDSNSDYKRQTSESITWRIRCRSGVDCTSAGKQYDVQRVVGDTNTGTVAIIGQSLVSDIAFTYLANGASIVPEKATDVRVTMDYDAIVNAYAKKETVTFEVRLRNVQ